MEKLFGTDGVRGEANQFLDGALAYKIGLAAATVLKKNHNNHKIVVGKDTRISGDMLEAGLIAGVCAAGVDVYCLGVIPTPAVAVLTRHLEAMAGVVISASHNPFQDNGIKFFNENGRKLPDKVEEEITQLIYQFDKIQKAAPEDLGRVYTYDEGATYYSEFLKRTSEARFDRLRIVMDCANGAASKIAPKVFRDLGAEVIEIASDPNGVNINQACGSTHTEMLQQRVIDEIADLGVAYDGDADRLLAVDAEGNLVDGDMLLCIFAIYLKAADALREDTVVATVMSNMGLEKTLADYDIKTAKSKVGDRYVIEMMEETGAILGGEQSGHIIFRRYNTTGDGIISSIKLAEIMALSGRSLKDLGNFMERYPQVLINVPVKRKENWDKEIEITLTIAKLEEKLGNEGRILVRASGTENILRVMVEGKDEVLIKEIANRIAQAIDATLNTDV